MDPSSHSSRNLNTSRFDSSHDNSHHHNNNVFPSPFPAPHHGPSGGPWPLGWASSNDWRLCVVSCTTYVSVVNSWIIWDSLQQVDCILLSRFLFLFFQGPYVCCNRVFDGQLTMNVCQGTLRLARLISLVLTLCRPDRLAQQKNVIVLSRGRFLGATWWIACITNWDIEACIHPISTNVFFLLEQSRHRPLLLLLLA